MQDPDHALGSASRFPKDQQVPCTFAASADGVARNVEKPAVSVIIPVYRAEKYLTRCLNSLLKQSFQDWEAVIVEDCGRDGSFAIAQKFAAQDARFRFLQNPENLGQGLSRDHGIAEARSEYLLMLDADDFLAPNALEALSREARTTGADIVVCGVRQLYRWSRRNYPEYQERVSGSGKAFLKAFFFGIASSRELPNVERAEWNKLIRTRLIRDNRLCHLPGRLLGEDYYFVVQLLCHAEKVSILPENLYFYDRRNGSSLTASRNLELFRTLFTAHRETLHLLQKEGLFTPDLAAAFWENTCRHLYFELLDRLSFFSDDFNDRLLSLCAEELKKELWQDTPQLWKGLELLYGLLQKKMTDPACRPDFRALKLRKIKVCYIPRWIAAAGRPVLNLLRRSKH